MQSMSFLFPNKNSLYILKRLLIPLWRQKEEITNIRPGDPLQSEEKEKFKMQLLLEKSYYREYGLYLECSGAGTLYRYIFESQYSIPILLDVFFSWNLYAKIILFFFFQIDFYPPKFHLFILTYFYLKIRLLSDVDKMTTHQVNIFTSNTIFFSCNSSRFQK